MEELAKVEQERGNLAGIIAPAILATFVSTAVAVVYCKGKDRKLSFKKLRQNGFGGESVMG